MRYVFDRKHIATESVPGLLQIEVRAQRSYKRTLISTGVKLLKSQFSDKGGFTCRKHPNAISVTSKVRKMYADIEQFVLSDKCNSLDDVQNFIKGKSANQGNITDAIKADFTTGKLTLVQHKVRRALVHNLEEYGKIKTFDSLTEDAIQDFHWWLVKVKKNNQQTIYKKFIALRLYCEAAVRHGVMRRNSFDNYKIDKGKSKVPVYLTKEEIDKLERMEFSIPHLERARDIFLFQCYTGLSYSDMQRFGRKDVTEEGGRKTIRSSRVKTDESFVLLFLPQAERIAEKYDYRLPKISNQKYNDYTKMVCSLAGINKNVTTHTARHSFAVWLINAGVPIESVSRAMGHSNIKQTQHYARLLANKVLDDMDKYLK